MTSAEWATARFTVPYRTGELTAVARRGGREIGRKTLRTVGTATSLRLTPDVHELTTGREVRFEVRGAGRPTKSPGRLTLTAKTDGLRPATLTLNVNP